MKFYIHDIRDFAHDGTMISTAYKYTAVIETTTEEDFRHLEAELRTISVPRPIRIMQQSLREQRVGRYAFVDKSDILQLKLIL